MYIYISTDVCTHMCIYIYTHKYTCVYLPKSEYVRMFHKLSKALLGPTG